MGEAEQRLLVATDCLSEGVNLQSLFDMVIHYDLSWNPTRSSSEKAGWIVWAASAACSLRIALLPGQRPSMALCWMSLLRRDRQSEMGGTGVTCRCQRNAARSRSSDECGVAAQKGQGAPRFARDAAAVETAPAGPLNKGSVGRAPLRTEHHQT